MNIEEVLLVVDAALESIFLSNVQELVLRQSWEGKTYPEIAESYGYEANYIKNVGYKLWSLLSQVFTEEVTKSNFRSVIRRQSAHLPTKRSPSPFTRDSINSTDSIQHSTCSETANKSENTQTSKSNEVESSPWDIADNIPKLDQHLVGIDIVKQCMKCPLIALFKPDETRQELNISLFLFSMASYWGLYPFCGRMCISLTSSPVNFSP